MRIVLFSMTDMGGKVRFVKSKPYNPAMTMVQTVCVELDLDQTQNNGGVYAIYRETRVGHLLPAFFVKFSLNYVARYESTGDRVISERGPYVRKFRLQQASLFAPLSNNC